VLRDAYRNAGVSPGQIQYIETHGTGTALGDPIEAYALGAVLSLDRAPEQPCAIGALEPLKIEDPASENILLTKEPVGESSHGLFLDLDPVSIVRRCPMSRRVLRTRRLLVSLID
jgi:beta-ketoacyl synthase-like protein